MEFYWVGVEVNVIFEAHEKKEAEMHRDRDERSAKALLHVWSAKSCRGCNQTTLGHAKPFTTDSSELRQTKIHTTYFVRYLPTHEDVG